MIKYWLDVSSDINRLLETEKFLAYFQKLLKIKIVR